MYLVPVAVANFGRGETSAEFVRAVLNMIEAMEEVLPKRFRDNPERVIQRMVCGISELDEADKPPEHKLFRKTLTAAGIKFTTVNWASYEPLAIGHSLQVREREAAFGCSGVPHLTPRRTITNCALKNRHSRNGKQWAAVNHHAPRRDPRMAKEIASCRIAHKKVIKGFVDGKWDDDTTEEVPISGITIGDWNDPHYPVWFDMETLVHDRLDYIRAWEVDGGVKFNMVGHMGFRIGIDGHKGHVALVAVS